MFGGFLVLLRGWCFLICYVQSSTFLGEGNISPKKI